MIEGGKFVIEFTDLSPIFGAGPDPGISCPVRLQENCDEN